MHPYPRPIGNASVALQGGEGKKKKQPASKSDGKYSSRDSAVTPALQNRGAFVALTSGRLVTVLPPPLTPKPWRC